MTTRASSRVRRTAAAGLAVYALAAGVILLTPVSFGGIVHAIAREVGTVTGLHFFGSGWIEFLANVVLFLPMGFLLTLLLRRACVGTILSVLVSIAVEIAQLHIPDRQSSLRDVVSNTIGAVLGAFVAWLIIRRRPRRPRS